MNLLFRVSLFSVFAEGLKNAFMLKFYKTTFVVFIDACFLEVMQNIFYLIHSLRYEKLSALEGVQIIYYLIHSI
jgi:hypothetical protein